MWNVTSNPPAAFPLKSIMCQKQNVNGEIFSAAAWPRSVCTPASLVSAGGVCFTGENAPLYNLLFKMKTPRKWWLEIGQWLQYKVAHNPLHMLPYISSGLSINLRQTGRLRIAVWISKGHTQRNTPASFHHLYHLVTCRAAQKQIRVSYFFMDVFNNSLSQLAPVLWQDIHPCTTSSPAQSSPALPLPAPCLPPNTL